MTADPGTLIALGGYLAALLVIGVICKRFVKNDSDFMLAGRKLGAGFIAFTLIAANFGGAFVLGTSQSATQVGASAIAFAVGIFIGLMILGIFVAPPMRASEATTVPGYLQQRYGSRVVRNAATVLSVAGLTGILAGQVSASTSVFSSIGFDPLWGGILSIVLIVGYTSISGMWGIAVTDVIQVTLIVIGVLAVLIFALQATGGVGPIVDHMESIGVTSPLNPLNLGWTFFLGGALPIIVHKMVGQDVLQRVFSSRSVASARNGAIIAGGATVIFAVVPALTGMAAITLYPDLDPSVGAIPTLMQELLPSWAAGILLAALLAAVLSTANTILLAASSNVSTDLYGQWPGYKPGLQLRVSRVASIAIGVVAFVIASTGAGILEILTYAFTMYGSGIFAAMIGGLYWSRGTDRGALAAIVVGSLTALLGILEIVPPTAVPTVVLAVLCSAVAYVIVSLLTKSTHSTDAPHPQTKKATGV